MKFNREELEVFISDIESKGFVEYPGQEYQSSDRVWWKSVHNDKNGTIIGVALYDYSKYSHIEDFYSRYPYSVMYCCIFKENDIVPRQDIVMSGMENYTVSQFEEYIKKVEKITLK